jgi:class 3 adenylate cyclase
VDPTIRYVRSADGTRLATWTFGVGPPLVFVPPPAFGTFETLWDVLDSRRGLELLAARRTIVAYDHRGFGLSDNDVTDFSFDAVGRDLDAVVGTLGAASYDVMARAAAGPVAIRHAARSAAVRRLVLTSAVARGRDMRLNPRRRALAPLAEVDFGLYCETMALIDFGWTDIGRRMAEISKRGSPHSMRAAWVARRDWDASDDVPRVTCPTLVQHFRAGEETISFQRARELVAALPNARLAVIETLRPVQFVFMDEPDAQAREILEFLDGDAAAPRTRPSDTAIILFADIVDSTVLTERLGDAVFRERARALHEALRRAIVDAGGTPVRGRLLGDGVLATFGSAADAIAAARGCRDAGAASALPLHLGLHAGDVVRDEGDVYGGAVNIAARIAAASAPGDILVSDVVRGLARTSAGVAFEDRGVATLKGVTDPQRLFAVHPG